MKAKECAEILRRYTSDVKTYRVTYDENNTINNVIEVKGRTYHEAMTIFYTEHIDAIATKMELIEDK